MFSDILHLTLHILRFLPFYAVTQLGQRISALIHRHTYKALPDPLVKNVVVIGGSFGGHQTVKRLVDTLPTGYRAVLVEKNSHFNWVFAFPRFSVTKGYEKYAFLPYYVLSKGAPEGIFRHVQDTAVHVTERDVELKSGERVPYEYLVVATGTSSALPSKVQATERVDAENELRDMQCRIEGSRRIAVVGGGAEFYPGKEVVLFHSRDQLLPSFGKRLHEHVLGVLMDLGVEVRLNERPKVFDKHTLCREGGEREEYDMIIPCTGQRPNSAILSTLSTDSISNHTLHVEVLPSMQISDRRFPRIFALGDVATTGGPRMARAAMFQADVVVNNILALIRGKSDLAVYKPNTVLEGSIKLTLGKTRLAMYARGDDGREILIPLNMGREDADIQKQWRFWGADVTQVDKEHALEMEPKRERDKEPPLRSNALCEEG